MEAEQSLDLTLDDPYKGFKPPITRNKGITIDDVVTLKITNPALTVPQAARLLDCSEDTIYYHLRKSEYTWTSINNTIEHFRKAESKLLSFKQLQALHALTPEKLKKDTALQNSTVYCQLRDKQRLIDGESTANIAYSNHTAKLTELDAEIQALEAELGVVDDDNGAE